MNEGMASNAWRRGGGVVPVCGESNRLFCVYTLPTPLKPMAGLYVRFHSAKLPMVLLWSSRLPGKVQRAVSGRSMSQRGSSQHNLAVAS